MREIYSILNIVFALLAVPPAGYLMSALIKERYLVVTEQKMLNTALSLLFGGFALGAILNALIALLAITSNGEVAHTISPIRGVYTNAFFMSMTWLLFYIKKNSKSR